ncbi:Disease resistance protein TIR-NBS-LRR class family [Prunus dulcis]|uniref:Disease resistance protein TIR-NBS-LRR class family n=1 Tax=Prunus dulcis TaxID=3755 RepID=A0A4Y1QX56_PRUDU|nr:Disease resistance protein TIR-NBS-LRR class family [Prunus dulcis]
MLGDWNTTTADIEQEASSEGTGDEESEAEQIPVEAPTISREDKIKNAKALSLIQGALTDELFPCIRNEKTAKGAWEILRSEFRGDKKIHQYQLVLSHQIIVTPN